MADSNELNALVPDEVFVTLKGEKIEVKPFNFLQVLKTLKILFKITEDIDDLGEIDQLTMFKLVVDNPEEAFQVASYATGKKSEYFHDIQLDEAVDLISSIYKVNKDFFGQKVQPKLEALRLSSLLSVTSTENLTSEPESEPEQKNDSPNEEKKLSAEV